jgi:hypothetical protein
MEVYRIDWINSKTQEIVTATIHTFESGAKGELDYRADLVKNGKSELIPNSKPYKYEVKNTTLLMLLDNDDFDSLIVGIGELGIE